MAAASDLTCLVEDLTGVELDQQDLTSDAHPAWHTVIDLSPAISSAGRVTNIPQPEDAPKQQVLPKSPSPSSQSRHLEFLSWISGRGSPSCQDSSKNSSVNFCRICHEGESGGERLISPCRCSGSVGLIHRSCIEKWLTIVNNDTCELCKQRYSVTRHPRPFSSWLCEPAVGDDQRNLVGDGVCFLILTPLAGISAYLCASGAAFYFQDKQSEAIGLICLSSLLVIIYMAWLVLTIRYHCQVWFKWRSNNQDIRLLNVSGQRPTTRRGSRYPISSQPRCEEQCVDDVEIIITSSGESGEMSNLFHSSASSLSSHAGLIQSSSPQDVGHLVSHGQADDLAVTLKELDAERSDCEAKILKSSELYLPLSPNIISRDPQEQSHCKVVLSTEDSDIYVQIPDFYPSPENKTKLPAPAATVPIPAPSVHILAATVPIPAPTVPIPADTVPIPAPTVPNPGPILSKACTSFSQLPQDHQLSIQGRAVSVPYLPDLREHFIALKSRQEPVTTAVKSRGTFSPSRPSRSVTFSVTQIQSSQGTVSRPSPPPLPVRKE